MDGPFLFGPCPEQDSTIIDVAKEGGQKNPSKVITFVTKHPSVTVPPLGLKTDVSP